MFFNFRYKEFNPVQVKYKYIPLTYSTRITLNEKFWDKPTNRISSYHTKSMQFNFELANLNKLVNDIYENLLFERKFPTPAILKNSLDERLGKKEPLKCNSKIIEFINTYIEHARDFGEITEAIIKTYIAFIERLKPFQKHNNTILKLDNLDAKTYSEIIGFIKERGFTKRRNITGTLKMHFTNSTRTLENSSGLQLKRELK